MSAVEVFAGPPTAPRTSATTAGLFLAQGGISEPIADELSEVLIAVLEHGQELRALPKESFRLLLAEHDDPIACAREHSCLREVGRDAGLDFIAIAEARTEETRTQLTVRRYSTATSLVRTQRFDFTGGLGEIADALQAARDELLRPEEAVLRISVPEKGARVSVDGLELGYTPLEPREVHQGKLRLHIEKDGFMPREKSVECRAGSDCNVALMLHRLPRAVPEKPAPDELAEPSSAEPAPTIAEPPASPTPRRVSTTRAFAWATLGVALAASATATTTGVLTHYTQQNLLSACDSDNQVCSITQREASRRQNRGEQLALATNITIGIAGAAAVASVVLFLIEPKGQPSTATIDVAQPPPPLSASADSTDAPDGVVRATPKLVVFPEMLPSSATIAPGLGARLTF